MNQIELDKLTAVCGLFPIVRKVTNALPGQFIGALWTRQLKTLKGVSAIITKETRATVRAGINHDARAKVQDAREQGELPAVNSGLPWGQWLAFPYVITHKGEFYLRLYPVENRFPRVIYRANGHVINKADAQMLCLASEFKEHDTAIGCFTLKLKSLQRVRA